MINTDGVKIVVYDTAYLREHKDEVSGRLPPEYQEVEFIESSGTQWINMYYKPNQDTSVIVDMAMTYIDNQINSIFGCQNYDNGIYTDAYCFGNITSATPNYITKYKDTTNNMPASASFYNGRRLYKMLKNVAYVDNILINTFQYSSFECTYNATLFTLNYNNTTSGTCTAKLYSCKIWNDTTLIRHYIPCFRKSDDAIGLYDLCGSICPLTSTPFYINSGEGEFNKGENIMVLLEINGTYISLESISQLFTTKNIIDNTKINYFVSLNNGSKLEISKDDYDAITEAYTPESSDNSEE